MEKTNVCCQQVVVACGDEMGWGKGRGTGDGRDLMSLLATPGGHSTRFKALNTPLRQI